MRTIGVCLAVWLGVGCFDEGGDGARTEAARAMAESLLAFPQIQANLDTNPGASGEALLKFVKTPVAAEGVLERPFDPAAAHGTARLATLPSDIPGCMTITGTTGCDGFTTNAGDTCTAPGFTMTGNATRTCNGCPAQPDLASCAYGWTLNLGFTFQNLSLQTATTGQLTTTPTTIDLDVRFGPFTLTSGNSSLAGDIRICTCGPATYSGLTLTNSNVVVKDFNPGPNQRCSLIHYDGQGVASTTAACVCPDNTTCGN